MTNGYLDTIRELLTDDSTPQSVSNKILFGSLQEIYRQMNLHDRQREELIEKVEAIGKQLDSLERRVAGLEERHVQAPSLTWLLQHKPRETIKTMLIILFFALLILAASEPLRFWVMGIVGAGP